MFENQDERFEIFEQLGEGANAVVWRAKDKLLGREVALKVLKVAPTAHSDSEREDQKKRFHQETQAAARLNHSNIVTLLEAGGTEGKPYIVYQLIDGVTLREWTNYVSPKSIELAVTMAKLAGAIHYAHARGIVHRDVKPENVLVDISGKPYITDFGLAQIADRRITEADVSVGTIAYLAPEQANCQEVDGRADIFAIGVVLFEILTGELPFRASTRAEYLAQLALTDAPQPTQLNREIHPDLSAICSRCLQRKPGRRYATAKELQEDFERFSNGQPTLTRPRSWIVRSYQHLQQRPRTLVIWGLSAFLLSTAVGVFQWNESARTQDFTSDIAAAHEVRELERLVAEVKNGRFNDPVVGQLRLRLADTSNFEDQIRYLYAINELQQLDESETDLLFQCAPDGFVRWARIIKPTLASQDSRRVAAACRSNLNEPNSNDQLRPVSVEWAALAAR